MRIRCLLIVLAVTFTVGVLTAPGYANLDPETIAAIWLFDDGNGDIAKDSSENGNDGNLIGGPKWVNGKFGKALEFDGVDDYVNVNYDSSLKLGNNGTLALWFKPSDLKGDTHTFISYGGTSYSTGHLLSHYLSSAFYGYWKTPGPAITFDPAFFIGEWAHVVMTNENGSLKFYLNGEEKGTSSSGGEITDDMPTYIGGTPTAWRASGIIDEVVVLNVKLEEDEIQTLMNDGLREFLTLAVNFSGKLTTTWADIKAQ